MQAGPLWFYCRLEHRVHFATPNFLDVAHGFLLDRRKASPNVPLCRLRAEQVHTLAFDEVGVIVEHAPEFLPHPVVDASRLDDILATGELARLTKYQCCTTL